MSLPHRLSRPEPEPDPLETVVSEVIGEALWRYRDLSARRTEDQARDLVLAEAAERSLSAAGREQLLSVALERVLTLDPEAPASARLLLGSDPHEDQTLTIRKSVFALGPQNVEAADALIDQLEKFHAGRLTKRGSKVEIALGLEQDAALHQALWDDPRIPASSENRLAMLCSIPRLRDRAVHLNQQDSSWLSAARGVFGSLRGKIS